VVQGNNIYENERAGIAVLRTINGTFTENDIYSNTRGGIHVYEDESTLEISRNEIYDTIGETTSRGGGISTQRGYPSWGGLAFTITCNKIYRNFAGGIHISVDSGTISNNLIYDNGRGGIRFMGVDAITNNTVVNNGKGGIIYSYKCLHNLIDEEPTGSTTYADLGSYILLDLQRSYEITDARLYFPDIGEDDPITTWDVYVGNSLENCTSDWGALVKESWIVGETGVGWYETSVTPTSGRYIKLIPTSGYTDPAVSEFNYKRTGSDEWFKPLAAVRQCTDIDGMNEWLGKILLPHGHPATPVLIRNNICAYNQKAGMRMCFDYTENSGERDYNLLYANYPWNDAQGRDNDPDCRWPNLDMSCTNQQYGGCGAHWDFGQPYPVVLDDPNDILKDPKFQDMDNDNYTLQGDSPAIDAGDPNSSYNDATDGTRNDMGAYGGPDPLDW
jgi:parallel beta-helix repeat protein